MAAQRAAIRRKQGRPAPEAAQTQARRALPGVARRQPALPTPEVAAQSAARVATPARVAAARVAAARVAAALQVRAQLGVRGEALPPRAMTCSSAISIRLATACSPNPS